MRAPQSFSRSSFKRLAVRWERRTELHDAFVSLACSLICWRCLKRSRPWSFYELYACIAVVKYHTRKAAMASVTGTPSRRRSSRIRVLAHGCAGPLAKSGLAES